MALDRVCTDVASDNGLEFDGGPKKRWKTLRLEDQSEEEHTQITWRITGTTRSRCKTLPVWAMDSEVLNLWHCVYAALYLKLGTINGWRRV